MKEQLEDTDHANRLVRKQTPNLLASVWHDLYADPNSENHFSCFSISDAETLRWTFIMASSKSHMATGSFEISSLGMFLISSRVFPAILRLMPFKEASRQTFVRSSPLYPSVRRATSSISTSGATWYMENMINQKTNWKAYIDASK